MATNIETQPTEKDIEHYINLKLYPVPYVNNQGYRIGNYHIEFDTKKSPLPFSSFDQVDHFLINLFDYAKKVPKNKKPTKDFNEQFFKHKKKKLVLFKPIKYRRQRPDEVANAEAAKASEATKAGGGRKTKNYARTKSNTKSIKNRTRKNR